MSIDAAAAAIQKELVRDIANVSYEALAKVAVRAIRKPTPDMIAAVREIGGPQAAAFAIATWPTMIDAMIAERIKNEH